MNTAAQATPLPPSPVTGRPPGRTLTLVLALTIIAATLGYYYWTSLVFHDSPHVIARALDDHYNLLAHGFRKGRLSLDLPVPPELIASKNPYDPALRPPVSPPPPHDVSYYRGRYYIYFGPAPVVTLFLPFSLLTGRDLSVPLAILLFCSGGYLALVALFFHLQRRYFPAASRVTVLASLLALGGGTMVIALLRRPNIWEVAGSAGFFYFSLSLLCLVRALASRRAVAWAAAGGLALGLAVASRPTYLVCSLLFALPLLRRRRPGTAAATPASFAYDWRAVGGAAATCGLIGLGLLVYNQARFGQPFEFGQKYQLSLIVEGEARHFSPAYIPYSLQVYIFSALRWFGAFPFVRSVQPPPTPPGHAGHEFAFGLLPNLPFVVFGLFLAAAWCVPRLRRAHDDARWSAFGVIAAAAFLTFAPLTVFFGTCVRYMADFAPSVMLLSCLGLLEGESRLGQPLARTLLRSAGWVLALFTVGVSALAMVDTYNAQPGTPPPRYAGLARGLNAPVRWLDRIRWPDYRPWDLTVTFPADRAHRREPLLTATKWSEPSASVFVEYLEANTLRFGYRERPGGPEIVFAPAVVALPGATYALRLSLGETDTPLLNGTKSWLRIVYGGRPIVMAPCVSPAAFPGRITIGEAPASAGVGLRFTGKIHHAAPAAVSDRAASAHENRPWGGARLRLTPTGDMRGRSLPLATTGVNGAGDILILRLTANDELVFGYDHWGAPGATSPPVPVRLDQPLVIEFWLPALAPADPPPPLRVAVDGQTIWRAPVRAFRPAPENIFFGCNPIGGTTSEPVLDRGVFEETRLPFPGK